MYPESNATRVVTGTLVSVPTSDHVPELMYAVELKSVGIPAIADAVSWHAGTISCVSLNASSAASGPCTRPTTVPARTIGGAASIGRPSSPKNLLRPVAGLQIHQPRVRRMRVL